MPESFASPSFRNHLPVRIHFGEGISEILPSLLAAEGVSRAALIIDDGLLNFNPPAAKVLADIEANGIKIRMKLKVREGLLGFMIIFLIT